MSPEALKVRQRRSARFVLVFLVVSLAAVSLLSGDEMSRAALAQQTSPSGSESGSGSPSASASSTSSTSPSESGSPSGSASATRSESPTPPPSSSTSTSSGPSPRGLILESNGNRTRAGARVILSGEIISNDRSCEAFQLVVIRQRVAGSETETDFAELETDENGLYSMTFRARETAEYRAVAPAGDGCAEGTSSIEPIEVRVNVRISTPDRTPDRGSKIRITVRVVPEHPDTRVVLERRKGKGFVEVASRRLDADSRAVFRITASWRGKRAFRATWPEQDDDHAAGRSRVLEIRVDRQTLRP
jgi:hypothetical protein